MTTRMAVLVDGDNIGAKHAAEIARIAAQRGAAHILRVYLDVQRASDWHGVPGFRLIHSGSGKNASDILLSIDAVALALREGVNSFVIASSDRDFSHIALRLREYGAAVCGIGEAKAPATFRQACQTFEQLGPNPKIALVERAKSKISDLDKHIIQMIAEHGGEGRGMPLSKLGAAMHALHKTQISTLPGKHWRAYLTAQPELYELDPRGPDARVRFKAGGLAQPASSAVKGISTALCHCAATA